MAVLDQFRLRATPHEFHVGEVRLLLDGSWLAVGPWTSAWYYRLGSADVRGLDSEEAGLLADEGPHLLLGGLTAAGVRWVDDPAAVGRAELKLLQLSVAERLGAQVPRSVGTNTTSAAERILAEGPTIAKALSPGVGIAPFVAEINQDDVRHVVQVSTFLQERVRATTDLRVVTVGGKAWSWRRLREPAVVDWRQDDPSGKRFQPARSTEVEELAIRICSGLGLTMSVQDWLETSDGPVFLEVNPQGAWLFLENSRDEVAPALVVHLLNHSTVSPGRWPRAIQRFVWDFLPAKWAPTNDGVVAPSFDEPVWVDEVAGHPLAIEVAEAASVIAVDRAKVAEDKASRLVQVALGLLTVGFALGAYQLGFAVGRLPEGLTTLVPIALAVGCLSLAAFEAVEIDRVGIYHHLSAGDLSGHGDSLAPVVRHAERGRRFANWTAEKKLSDLMQARAWFNRGLAALVVAGLVAAGTRASEPDTPTGPTTTTTSSSTTAP